MIYWNTHDTTGYEDCFKDVEDVQIDIKSVTFEISFEPEVAHKLSKVAKEEGVSLDDLVNSWIKEKLSQEAKAMPVR